MPCPVCAPAIGTATSKTSSTAAFVSLRVRRVGVPQAGKAISQGDLPAAERLLNAVLAESPGDADALNLLGIVRAQEQNTVEAERLFRLARAAAPTYCVSSWRIRAIGRKNHWVD